MKKKVFPFFVVFLQFAGVLFCQQTNIPEKVLFIGNSYTYFWNLPQSVAVMADDRGLEMVTRQSTAGGSNLGQHWRSEKELESTDLIEQGGFDAVVIQDHSLRAIEHPDSLVYFGRLMGELIRKNGARPYVYVTWAREKDPAKQSEITSRYTELAGLINAEIVPAGPAWELAKKEDPGISLYDEDGSHPNTLGTYLTACVFFGVLTKQSPVGLPKRLITEDRDGEKLYLNIQSDEKAAFCQRIADQVVRSMMD